MLTESTAWIVFGISAGLFLVTFIVGTRRNSRINMRAWGIACAVLFAIAFVSAIAALIIGRLL